MIGKPFINEMLSSAIESYLKYKDKPESIEFSSFPVMAIRTLVFIYGELDIINPYITRNENNMGGFNNNLVKYGFSLEKVEKFKNLFMTYRDEVNQMKKPNTSFLKIEQYLIDMYFCKQKNMNLSSEQLESFRRYLYLKENSNPIIQNDLQRFLVDINEIDMYFATSIYMSNHNFSLEEVRRSTLLPEAYMLLGYSMEQISLLNDVDLRNVNQQVCQFFKVDLNATNKDEVLAKAVNYYKRYGNRVTSGNGFVDFLLFASVLVTSVLLMSLFIIL